MTTIRPARLADAEAIGSILAAALPDKFCTIFRADETTVAEIMAEMCRLSGGAMLNDALVAEVEGKVVGVVLIKRAETRNEPETSLVFRWLRSQLGWRRAAWAVLALDALETKTPIGANDTYLDTLAVHPDVQGQSIGNALLRDLTERARGWGKRRITLYVTGNNEGARRLYERMGFQIERVELSYITSWLFGFREAVYMSRTLAG